jgi:pseudouridine-5'-phosphate glycosidase
MLVTNPIPEADAMNAALINQKIEEALAEAKANGIHGKDTTPFLLDRIQRITGGDSLVSNIALVKNNAALSARIAVAMAKAAR